MTARVMFDASATFAASRTRRGKVAIGIWRHKRRDENGDPVDDGQHRPKKGCVSFAAPCMYVGQRRPGSVRQGLDAREADGAALPFTV